ncbi:hypothetical protein [Streptantibioticus ferralitis]|uniref:Uncharacterized protein n=1 Tax=Streptantibioticus ferralitis TaxID=236510 RepID=A0ABT5ZBY3_9ACTN|nr:hypothetical protein [Streptantibioticus ferralitis]MDF2260535.1 hypothetical protein [Streptantibioticus ferralitis]
MSATLLVPFGVRHLISPPEGTEEDPVITYSEALQLNVSAQGNPWHALAANKPETKTETSNGDGSTPGSDSGTDLY